MLESFRGALKRREIFTAPSIRFADPRRGLLEGAAWAAARVTVCRTLGRSADGGAELAGLERRLDRAYRRVAANLPSNPQLRFEQRRGRQELVLTGLEHLPEVDLPDVLLEVAARTGFHRAFTHLAERGAKVDGFTTSLCAVLVAGACNIGLGPLLRPEDPALARARLSWVAQNFVRDETIAAANARLVPPRTPCRSPASGATARSPPPTACASSSRAGPSTPGPTRATSAPGAASPITT